MRQLRAQDREQRPEVLAPLAIMSRPPQMTGWFAAIVFRRD
jgi:hypothetical protein